MDTTVSLLGLITYGSSLEWPHESNYEFNVSVTLNITLLAAVFLPGRSCEVRQMGFKPLILKSIFHFPSFIHPFIQTEKPALTHFDFSINLEKKCNWDFILGSRWHSWNFWVLRSSLSKFSNTLSPLTGELSFFFYRTIEMTAVLQSWMGQSRPTIPTGNVANGRARSVLGSGKPCFLSFSGIRLFQIVQICTTQDFVWWTRASNWFKTNLTPPPPSPAGYVRDLKKHRIHKMELCMSNRSQI